MFRPAADIPRPMPSREYFMSNLFVKHLQQPPYMRKVHNGNNILIDFDCLIR